MATENTPQRRKMFDGERERELWLPVDGPGDSDLDLVKSSLDRVGGHPTWRIYASDIPGGLRHYSGTRFLWALKGSHWAGRLHSARRDSCYAPEPWSPGASLGWDYYRDLHEA